MEANVRVQASMAPTNLSQGRQAAPAVQNDSTSVAAPSRTRPAPNPQRSPAPELTSGQGVNIVIAQPNGNPRVAEDLASSEFPLPFSDGEISETTIARYVNAVNEALDPSFFRLNFDIHEDTNMAMIQVVDRNTEEVLREIPPESRLDIMARIQEFAGLLFDERS
jgi:flagellar protein FlaG